MSLSNGANASDFTLTSALSLKGEGESKPWMRPHVNVPRESAVVSAESFVHPVGVSVPHVLCREGYS